MKETTLKLKRNFKIITLIIIVILLFTASSLISPFFLDINNILNLLVQVSVLAILAIGMTYVIISTGLDLSVGSNIAFSGLIGVLVFKSTGNPLLGMLFCIIAGAFIGLLNGLMIGYLKINAFMATLSTLAIARGATLLITGGRTISVTNNIFNFLGQGTLFNIPVILILIPILYVAFYFVLKRTIFGRSIYALGGNEKAAIVAGIKSKLIILYIYMLSGALAGLCAIFIVGRLSSLQPWAGLGTEFETVIAVVLGGINLVGGEGELHESFVGVIILAIILNILGLLPISPFYQYITKGLIMIAAVFIYGRLQKYSI